MFFNFKGPALYPLSRVTRALLCKAGSMHEFRQFRLAARLAALIAQDINPEFANDRP